MGKLSHITVYIHFYDSINTNRLRPCHKFRCTRACFLPGMVRYSMVYTVSAHRLGGEHRRLQRARSAPVLCLGSTEAHTTDGTLASLQCSGDHRAGGSAAQRAATHLHQGPHAGAS